MQGSSASTAAFRSTTAATRTPSPASSTSPTTPTWTPARPTRCPPRSRPHGQTSGICGRSGASRPACGTATRSPPRPGPSTCYRCSWGTATTTARTPGWNSTSTWGPISTGAVSRRAPPLIPFTSGCLWRGQAGRRCAW